MRGEIACSRPIAENEKWLPKSLYIGVSGRVISPKVYFAVGISGQMHGLVMLDKEGNWVPAVDPVHYDKKAARCSTWWA